MNTDIFEPQQSIMRLGIGLDPGPGRRNVKTEAWKQAMGTNSNVAPRLELLADTKRRWDLFGASAATQFLLLSLLLVLPLVYPDQLKLSLHYDVMPLALPVTEVPVAPPPPTPKVKPKAIQPEPEIKVEPPKVAKLIAPKPIRPKPKNVETKQPEFKQALEVAKLEPISDLPRRPREEVKTGNLSTGSAAPATLNLPVHKVQTGGFGDPNGLPGPGDPNKRANINRKGSPLLPGGPGYGNGTGGANGARGTVASTGFGNGTANPPPGGTGNRRGAVQTTGFGDATAPVEAPKKKAAAGENPTTTVEILDKPHPVYSTEGRKLKIEGDVVIDLVFLASAQVQVRGVVSGLGHGLDESAVQAAKQIRFKPAKRDGQPVDFPARVRIVFRMAY